VLRRLADRLAENPVAFHWLRKLPELNYRATKDRLRRTLERVKPARVLDAGCGTGEFAPLFDAAGYLGVDVHEGYVRYAARLNPRHRFLRADLVGWPGDGAPFDLVLINGVMHHLDDATARGLLQVAHRHTRPGGTLLVIEDVHLPEAGAATSLVHSLDHGAHIRPADEWKRLVSEFVQIEETETFKSGVCPYQWMLGRRI
jgi:SAM-dependent methyltransferase